MAERNLVLDQLEGSRQRLTPCKDCHANSSNFDRPFLAQVVGRARQLQAVEADRAMAH